MEEHIYTEKLQSSLTTFLFVDLALIFLVLFGWRVTTVGWKFTPGLFLFLGVFFLFYVFNYRTLRIQISEEALVLKFGLVRWRTELVNIHDCAPDDPPLWIKYGGAGVHFAMVHGIYRAFFNFLEGPRILVTFKENQGPVKALSFSTRQPDQIQELLGRRISESLNPNFFCPPIFWTSLSLDWRRSTRMDGRSIRLLLQERPRSAA